MSKVSVSRQINVSAKKVWNELSSFRGIENYSPIASSITSGEGNGATRTCVMPDGAKINEILNFVKHDEMEMQYIITDGPFPVTKYVSDIKITNLDSENSDVTWECEFESSSDVEEDMKELFSGFYNVIIETLETYLKQ